MQDYSAICAYGTSYNTGLASLPIKMVDMSVNFLISNCNPLCRPQYSQLRQVWVRFSTFRF